MNYALAVRALVGVDLDRREAEVATSAAAARSPTVVRSSWLGRSADRPMVRTGSGALLELGRRHAGAVNEDRVDTSCLPRRPTRPKCRRW